MSTLKILLKKELYEAFATKKALIMWIACLGIGLMSPIFAKLTPDVLALYAPEGMDFSIGTPSAKDAWYQFFKDGPIIGVLVSVLCYSNSIPKEIETGSLTNILSKGVSRSVFFSSKLAAALMIWICGITICVTSCYVYTEILFDDSAPINWLVSLIGPMCFGVFIITLLFLIEAISVNTLFSIGGTIGFFALLMIANIIRPFAEYNPVSLIQNNSEYIFQTSPKFYYLKIIICIILSIITYYVGVKKFKKLAI